MMSLTFGLFTQVSGSGPLGPLVSLLRRHLKEFSDSHCFASTDKLFHALTLDGKKEL